ncbi:hypothetical protein [uncultured Shewanella sp.]|uniref:COG3014 family protein n=1 Tax=uncultured Shewanella sp. TaxID=173975 RepID=UPI0026114C86|nr:hypothetical protein [uncultured Shewanella sp.]
MKAQYLLYLLLLTLSGCAINSVFINYPSQIASVKAELNTNTPLESLSRLTPKISGNDGLLYAQEAGRVAQIGGDFEASKALYRQAVNDYITFDNKATISVTDTGATASSLLINDNVIPYRGPGYERIMLHQYQALNYIFSNDFEGALVEVRRSNELQSTEQAKYEESNQSVQAMSNGTVNTEMNKLGRAAGSTTSAFLNAYSYYTTGVLHEVLGEPNDAFIDYRKAAQISPNNPYVHQDLVRLAKQLGMPQYAEFKRRWGDAIFPKAGQGQVIFLIERGFVPAKQSFTVPFPIKDQWQSISLATYPSRVPQVRSARIQGIGSLLQAAPIADISALAITALKEDLPAALARQVARVYAKYSLAQKASDWGSAAIQIFNLVSEQADRRSWLTLPQQAQIARKYLNSGQYDIQLDNNSTTPINIESNRTTLIWVIDTGTYTRFYSTII